ncbi:MAG: GNAT family N-acetyltransferase [Deltaproteobacteria bacterium]|nr:GNAT family N-acetyltransferase [Deltaproteobacteria bacterium]
MKVVRSIEEAAWRRYVDDHPEGKIFHTPEMFQVFAKVKHFHPTFWAVTNDDMGVIALLLPVQITIIGGGFHRLTSRAVVYGSVLCAPGAEGQQALTKLLQVYSCSVKGQVLFTELRNMSDQSDSQPTLRAQGFVYEEHLNYLIDLNRPLDDIMQSFGPRTRKNIRWGLRQNKVIIEEANQSEQISVCYEILAKTYARVQTPLADRSLFEKAFEVLYPKGMVKFLLARVGDNYAAASVELIYKDVIYGWYGGVDREYSRYIPNELLMWHIISWGVENGYCVYDFGGAGKPDEEYGVRDFKAKFKGELVCFGRNTLVHAPRLLQLSMLGYRFYRQLFTLKSFK